MTNCFSLKSALTTIKYLVAAGVNPNMKDSIGQTVIFYFCRDNKMEICKFLLENGAQINDQDYYLQTPIFYAAR